ncbi:PilZ domain-containing protein [Methylobacterium nonmethylotrophicum]|nr:PilZ domain-containing protein [Methylobacterium nonmethylotrophicum]
MNDATTIATGDEAGASGARADEKRACQRHRTSMPATILLSHSDRVHCIVRDLSDGGAKIGVSKRYALTDRFWIVIRHANLARRAALVWRRGEFAGIAFDRPRR